MTKEEIINNGHFLQNELYSQFEITLFLPFFKKEVKILAINVLSAESEAEMNLIVAVLNELLTFEQKNEVWLKREVWNHYQSCIKNNSYNGVILHGFNNEADANKAHFNIFSEEDAFKSIFLDQIWFDVSFLDFRYYNLEFNCPWEREHGIKIGVMNGEFDSIE